MLVKTNQKDKNGKDLGIYQNALTGQKGKLNSLENKVRTNRKSTLGRRIDYQTVNKVIGEVEILRNVHNSDNSIKVDSRGIKIRKLKKIKITESVNKTIKHVQETPNALRRKIALLSFMDRIEVLKSKWHKAHPEYQKKE